MDEKRRRFEVSCEEWTIVSSDALQLAHALSPRLAPSPTTSSQAANKSVGNGPRLRTTHGYGLAVVGAPLYEPDAASVDVGIAYLFNPWTSTLVTTVQNPRSAAVAARAEEGSIGIRAFVSEIRIDSIGIRAEGEKGAPCVEIAALQARGELVRKRLALTDVNDTQAAEVPVFRAEGTVDDGDFLDQFGAERLECTEVTLAVTLCALVLLHVVDENLEAAVDAAVIEVEAEAPDLQRLAPALVLSCVDSCIELLH